MSSLRSLNSFFYKYRWRLFTGIVFVSLANWFSLFPAQITRQAVDYVMAQKKVFDYLPNSDLDVFYGGVINKIFWLSLTIFAVVLVRGVFMFFMRQTIIVMSRNIEYDQKNQIYKHYQQLDVNFYASNSTGDLMNRISEDVSRVRMYTGPAVMYTINIIVMVILIFIAMIKINISLTLIVLSPMPVMVIMIYYVQSIINKKGEKVQESLSSLSTTVQETFAGVRVIKSFNKEALFEKLFSRHTRNYFNQSMDLARVHALFYPSILLLVGLSSVAILYYGGILALNNKISYGNVAEFIIYVNMLMWPVGSLGWVITLMQRADASQRRINEFLCIKPSIVDSSSPQETNINSHITFNNVSYRYPGKNSDALHNLNFTIHKGETLAILGTTGSGKTTLANLLVRLIECTLGQIKINNIPINNIKLSHLRTHTGYVPQDALLFSDSIKNNISFGLHDLATDKKIEDAAKAAHVYEDIVSFKNGFETMLGERGVSLSGGQKQRVSIARALIKEPQLLLLDDCLSAVDTHTEEKIMQNMSAYFSNRTTIILGHRISSVKYANRIFVLHQGQLVEEGTHQSLMEKKGLYASINFEQRASQNQPV